MKKNLTKQFFYWSLALVILTIPFPKYSLNSQSIILLFISWLFHNSFKEKIANLKNFITPFLLISSLFWLSLFSTLYSLNIDQALKVVVRNLPLIIFPLVLFSTIKDANGIMKVLKIFSIAVIVALLFGYVKAVYLKANNLGDFFYYTDFAKVLGIHTTYFALFIVIAMTFFVLDRIKFKSVSTFITVGALLFLVFALYTISARVSLLALLVIGLILILGHGKMMSRKKKLVLFSSILLMVLAFSISPNFQKRNSGNSNFGYQAPELNSRVLHWQVVLHQINKNNIFIGSGFGPAYDNLYQEYLNAGFIEGYRREYNAHNQFLETTLRYGTIGLLFLLSILIYSLFKAIKSREIIPMLIMSILVIFMLTESILERHSGIVVFSLFTSLCFLEFKFKHKDYSKDYLS